MEYALVTASTAGIGFAIAERLLREGFFCYVNYANNDERAASASKKLSLFSENFKVIKANLSSLEGVQKLAKSIGENVKLKHLVLNCGITDKTPFGDVTLEKWNEVITTNLTMPFFLLQEFFDKLEEESSVVLISSILACHPHAMSISYSVSKAALNSLCQNMVKVFASKKIRINALEPGFVNTDWQKKKTPEHRRRIENNIALSRFAEADEVADMCYSLLKNTYVNGAIVSLCGGYNML
jgi:NAD(P)-dependent dehydrogenase (short-subunit alcohol dehydrogenase family)